MFARLLPLLPKLASVVFASLLGLFCVALLTVGLKTNNLAEPLKLTGSTEVGGPFESSNTNARYALVEAIVENKTFLLNLEQARFAVPDVVLSNGNFFTSFTPGISFLAVPFYQLGKLYQVERLAVFFLTITFAVLNGVLIYSLLKRVKVQTFAALFGAGIFLFATNALTYAATLTQHHASTAIILVAVHVALNKKSLINNLIFGACCGLGFLFDFPNLFMLTPVGLYLLAQHFSFKHLGEKIRLSFNLSVVAILLTFIPLTGIFLWYNTHTTGSATVFSQFSHRTDYFDTAEQQEQHLQAALKRDEWAATLPFYTRLQLQGAYILLLSNERSWLWYSPILLVGLWGLWVWYKNHPQLVVLITSIISVNIILYTMFGDPWGGWSFGPRYLIPSAALMAAAVGYGASFIRAQKLFWLITVPILTYSLLISAAGAITSATIPPRQEAVALQNYVPYTYNFNFKLLEQNLSHSLVYRLYFANSLTSIQFYVRYAALLVVLFYAIGIGSVIERRKHA